MKVRSKRQDAQANRERVLDAALDVFSEQGIEGSTETIATRAGVGVATVFRHFPSKRELLEAALERMITQLAESLEQLAEREDAEEAFFEALERVVERAGTKKALAEGLSGLGEPIRSRVWSSQLRSSLTRLLERAQQAGAVRDDIGIDELSAVLVAAARTIEHTRGDPELHARVLRVIFDGLRPAGAARRALRQT